MAFKDYLKQAGRNVRDNVMDEIHTGMGMPPRPQVPLKKKPGKTYLTHYDLSGRVKRVEEYESHRFSNLGRKIKRKSSELDKFMGSYYDLF